MLLVAVINPGLGSFHRVTCYLLFVFNQVSAVLVGERVPQAKNTEKKKVSALSHYY